MFLSFTLSRNRRGMKKKRRKRGREKRSKTGRRKRKRILSLKSTITGKLTFVVPLSIFGIKFPQFKDKIMFTCLFLIKSDISFEI